MKWSKELRSTPRTVMPLGFNPSRMPQNFSLGECKLTTTIELSSMLAGWIWLLDFTAGEGLWGMRVRSKRHGSRTTRRKQELRFCERLELLEGDVRSQFAEEQSIGDDVDEGEFGDDVVDDFHACKRKRAF